MFYKRTSPLVVLHDGGGDGGRDLSLQGTGHARVIEMGAYVTGLAAMIELDDPPAVPPDGCVDPLMWQLAWQRFQLHRRNSVSECVTCRARSCPGPDLAREGLATAMGIPVALSAYWTAFARVMRNPRHTTTEAA